MGSSESVAATWIKFPEYTVEPLSQRYTRTAENIYRYESDTGFSAEIKFDDLGLVVTYPGGGERIAALKRSDRSGGKNCSSGSATANSWVLHRDASVLPSFSQRFQAH
jgi:hypothetical protein